MTARQQHDFTNKIINIICTIGVSLAIMLQIVSSIRELGVLHNAE